MFITFLIAVASFEIGSVFTMLMNALNDSKRALFLHGYNAPKSLPIVDKFLGRKNQIASSKERFAAARIVQAVRYLVNTQMFEEFVCLNVIEAIQTWRQGKETPEDVKLFA